MLHERSKLSGPSGILMTTAWSQDGRLFAFADGDDLGIRLVDAGTYQDVRRWQAHTEPVWCLSFSPDGKWLLSPSEDHTVGVWEVATGKLVARLVGRGGISHPATRRPGAGRCSQPPGRARGADEDRRLGPARARIGVAGGRQSRLPESSSQAGLNSTGMIGLWE